MGDWGISEIGELKSRKGGLDLVAALRARPFRMTAGAAAAMARRAERAEKAQQHLADARAAEERAAEV